MAVHLEEMERQVQAAREGVTHTAAEIERRLRPDRILDGGLAWLREDPAGRAVQRQAAGLLRAHPVSLSLIGIGLVWMILEGLRETRPNDDGPLLLDQFWSGEEEA